jgi:hypothetical protein
MKFWQIETIERLNKQIVYPSLFLSHDKYFHLYTFNFNNTLIFSKIMKI